MRKRIGAVLLVGSMIASMLVGCGSSDNNTVTQNATSDVTLTFSYWGDANEKAAIENVLQEFTDTTGIAVEQLYIPDDYMTKLDAMAAAGEMPDCGYLTESFVIEWALEGMIEDMSDMVSNVDIIDDCLYKTPDGSVAAASIANETICLYYNKKAFDEAGIDYPPASAEDAWSWDEFLDVCRQLTVDKNGNHPGDADFDENNIKTYGFRTDKWAFYLEPLLRSNGGGIYSDDGKEVIIDSPESTEVLQALADMINVEHVSPTEDSSVTSMDMASAFLSDTLAMQIGGQWSVQTMMEAEADGVEWGIAVLPYFKEKVTGNTGTPVVMFQGSEHPEEQALLAEFFLNPEYVKSMIQSGLWQPTSEKWYTDETYINEWVQDGFPDNYREAIIDYTLECMQQNSWYTVAYTSEVADIWLPALDNVWNGEESAQNAINSVADSIREVHQKYLNQIQ